MALAGRAVHKGPCAQSEQKTDDYTHSSSGDGCNRNNQKVAVGNNEWAPCPYLPPKIPGKNEPPDIPAPKKDGDVNGKWLKLDEEPPDINTDDDVTEMRSGNENGDVTNARGGATEDDGRENDVIIGSENQIINIARNGKADDGGGNLDVINGSYVQKLFEQDELIFHQKREEMKRAFREYDKGTAKWEEEIDRTMEVESKRWENIIHFMIELELFDDKTRYETDEEVGNVSSLTFSRKGVKGEEQLVRINCGSIEPRQLHRSMSPRIYRTYRSRHNYLK